MPADPAAVARLTSWEGMGRSILRRIEVYEAAVRANAPYRPEHTGSHIVDSIGHETSTEGEFLVARVGVNPHEHVRGYALMVHQGTRPHTIVPRRSKSLRFRVGGRIVYATRVSHPGTSPDPFLTRFMRELV